MDIKTACRNYNMSAKNVALEKLRASKRQQSALRRGIYFLSLRIFR